MLLAVTLDALLSFDNHVTNIIPAWTFHTRALSPLCPLLTLEAAKAVAVSVVGSRLDYCNGLLWQDGAELQLSLAGAVHSGTYFPSLVVS